MMASFYYYDQDPSGFCFFFLLGTGVPRIEMIPKSRNDTDHEMIPISLHIVPEMVPN